MDCIKIFFNDLFQGEVKIESDSITIGRTEENDICIANSAVSIRHAIIKKEGEEYFIEDCGSKNGTSINGQNIRRQLLEYGDSITIFKHVLKLSPWIPGTEIGAPDCSNGQTIDQTGTVEVDLSQIASLSGQNHVAKQPGPTSRLVLLGENGVQQEISLVKRSFKIGKKIDCDLPAKGWFAPGIAAELKHVGADYFIYPMKRGRVTINGNGITQPTKLNTGDNLSIRELSLIYL